MTTQLTADDVTCPDCQAPPHIQCRGHLGTHADRERFAALQNLEHGTCNLCRRPMVRNTQGHLDGGPEVWHHHPGDAAACPVLPDPSTDWPAYAEKINAGLAPGRPGPEHFLPHCPDCRQGKHAACVNGAWDDVTDALTECGCHLADHLAPAVSRQTTRPADEETR